MGRNNIARYHTQFDIIQSPPTSIFIATHFEYLELSHCKHAIEIRNILIMIFFVSDLL